MNCKPIETRKELPKKPGKSNYEYVRCLIFVNGNWEIGMWNCEHLCWDDDYGDDFRYDPYKPTHWMPLPPPPGEAVPPAVKVKPLVWSEDHGEGYRIFYAKTPVGRFAFGTDKLGQSYWQDNSSMNLGEDVASEAEAEKEAQAAYAAAIMETDIFKCLNLVQEGEAEPHHATEHLSSSLIGALAILREEVISQAQSEEGQ